MKTIHLLYFIHDLAPFGAQRVVLNTVKHLDSHTFKVTVCSFSGNETLSKELIKYGVEVILLRAKRFLDFFAWIKFIIYLIRSRPDIIQTNLPELSFFVRLIALFLRNVHVVHNIQNPIASEPFYWRLINYTTLVLCNAIVFCSQGICNDARLKSQYVLKKTFVVQNGMEIDHVNDASMEKLHQELCIDKNESIVACIGRLSEQKGQDTLIEALSILLKNKRKLKLLLAGDGPMCQKLTEIAERLKVKQEIIFLGERRDVSRILHISDVYAAPSRWEGLSLALGEAMLSRKPCVATSIPGHADILHNNITGIAVPPDNAEALANGIDWLLSHPDEAEKMAAVASDFIRKNFSTHEMAKKFEKIYLSLLKR